MKQRASKLQGWEQKRVSEIAFIRSGSVNPSRFPKETFELFSIPAFDNHRRPEHVIGGEVKSNKTIVEPRDCLFSKLNPRIPRVWIVPRTEGYRQIASTEFLPIYPKATNGAPWFLPEFMAYLFSWAGFRESFVGQVEASTRSRERLKPFQLMERQVILPPLPVQERVVQILQKADEVRHKRQQAQDIAETIRRSLFADMFGEPEPNSQAWPVGPLNDLLDPGVERVNPSSAFPEQEFTYIEIAGVKDFRIGETKRLLGADAPSRARQVVRAGDVLYSMTRPNLLNIAVVPEELDGTICTTGFVVLRPKKAEDTAFVFEIVKSDHFTEAMSRLAEAKSLYPAVDEAQVRQFPVIHPGAPARAHFGKAIAQLFGVGSAARACSEIGDAVFSSLLSRAFTGELTAEWEATNRDDISARVAFHERLPRLLVLALLTEKARRTGKKVVEAAVLVTALMKYVFLLQMEGNGGRRRLYHFVPYHYGPFAKELYTDLQKLQEEGLVRVDNNTEEDKTKITLADPAKTEQTLAELPDDLKEDAATIIETYGDLDHNALLKTVYEKYPAYAKKSRLRRARGAGHSTKSRGKKGQA